MVKCLDCAVDKEASGFYAHPNMAHGHVNVCKECHKTRMLVRRRTNPSVQEYDRARSKTPARKAKAAEYRKVYNAANPQAQRARNLVAKAVKTGKLTRLPCEFCARPDVHAHHKDYSRPLDVIWLCPKCHHRLHAAFPELEGKSKVG